MCSYITPEASLVIASSLSLLSEEVNGFISVGLCWLLAFMPPACAKLTIEAGLGGGSWFGRTDLHSVYSARQNFKRNKDG